MSPTPETAGEPTDATKPVILGLSRNVFVLGLVSLLTDVSSEMIFPIMALFLSNVLGVQVSLIGLIEGVADGTSSLLKVFSGWFSDKIGRRQPIVAFGYGLSTVAKPFLILSTSWWHVLGVRFTDRVGKGMRTSPRDALIADSTEGATMGRSFGFHRGMDTAGAVGGLVVAALVVYLMQASDPFLMRSTYQVLVAISIIPALLAVLLIVIFVRDRRSRRASTQRVSLRLKGLDRRFKIFLIVIVIFTLGNSSDAFLILRAQNLGVGTLNILLMLIGFNVLDTIVSVPAGVLSDRIGRRRVLVASWILYGAVYLGFAFANVGWQVWGLYAVYGLYYGVTEGVGRAFVADMVPASEQRGTAFGVYNAAVGLVALPASFIAGLLWDAINPSAPFLLGATLAILAAILLMTIIHERKPASASADI
ncbi:MAG: MFS transporter [Chloroflexi bacterium]|nr:MFS transporter [Chloroflexota bacterium]